MNTIISIFWIGLTVLWCILGFKLVRELKQERDQ